MMSFLSFLIFAIVSVALLGIYGYIFHSAFIKGLIGDGKIYELTYQFLLISVIGGSIAWLYKTFDHFRGKRSALREMHTELMHAYNQAKRVRRKLRAILCTANEINPSTEIISTDYEEQMEELSDAQLTFEVFAKRAEDSGLWFLGSKTLANSLKTIEEYLNQILKEYQSEFAKFSGDIPKRQLSQLPKLMEFIGPFDEAKDFQKCFKYPIRDALKALGKVILR